jgi:hypothetical protein
MHFAWSSNLDSASAHAVKGSNAPFSPFVFINAFSTQVVNAVLGVAEH